MFFGFKNSFYTNTWKNTAEFAKHTKTQGTLNIYEIIIALNYY